MIWIFELIFGLIFVFLTPLLVHVCESFKWCKCSGTVVWTKITGWDRMNPRSTADSDLPDTIYVYIYNIIQASQHRFFPSHHDQTIESMCKSWDLSQGDPSPSWGQHEDKQIQNQTEYIYIYHQYSPMLQLQTESSLPAQAAMVQFWFKSEW